MMNNRKILSDRPEKPEEEHRENIIRYYGPELEEKVTKIWSKGLDLLSEVKNEVDKIWDIMKDDYTPVISSLVDNITPILILKEMLNYNIDVTKKNIDEINALSARNIEPAVLLESVNGLPYKMQKIENYQTLTYDKMTERLDIRKEMTLAGRGIKCFMFGGAGTRAGYICENQPKYRLTIANLIQRFIDPNYHCEPGHKLEETEAKEIVRKNLEDLKEIINKELLSKIKKPSEDEKLRIRKNSEDIVKRLGQKIEELRQELSFADGKYEFLLNQNLGVLKILRYRYELEKIIRSEYLKLRSTIKEEYATYFEEHMARQMIQVSISNETREEVEELFEKYNFFGFKPENVVFTVTPNNVLFMPSLEGTVPDVTLMTNNEKTKALLKYLKDNIKVMPIEKESLAAILKSLFIVRHGSNFEDIHSLQSFDWNKLAEEFISKNTLPNQGHGYLIIQSGMPGGSYSFQKTEAGYRKIPLTIDCEGQKKEVSAFQYMANSKEDGIWNNQNVDDMDSLDIAIDVTRLWAIRDIEKHGYVFEYGENRDKTKGGSLIVKFFQDNEGNIKKRLEAWEENMLRKPELQEKIFNRNPQVPYNRMSMYGDVSVMAAATADPDNKLNVVLNLKGFSSGEEIKINIGNKNLSINFPYFIGETVSGDMTQQSVLGPDDDEKIDMKAIYEQGLNVNNFKENRQVINFVEKILDIVKKDKNHDKTMLDYLDFLSNFK